MSIDERLEALVQSVELLAGMHKELIETQRKTEEEIRELAKSQMRSNRRFERFELIMADFGGIFEDRLHKLEDRLFRDDEEKT